MTDAQVGDLVVATFRPQWENRGGKSYTVTGEVWQPEGMRNLFVGGLKLAGAVHVDIVERAA